MAPVAGLPGNVYRLGVYVPNPATPLPTQVGVELVMGAVNPSNPGNSALLSQPGIILNVKP